MNKLLIALISLFCTLNGQITYNEWKEIQETHPDYATVYLCSQISGQDIALRYAKKITSQMLVESDSNTRKLDSTYAIPDYGITIGDLLLNIIDWINERPKLWNLDIKDLTLFARLDIYGDDETKKYVKAKILKALSTKL